MELAVSPGAAKQLKAIPAADARRLLYALKEIAAAHPQRMSFVTELVGGANEWRARKGDDRAIYRIDGDLITIIAVGHRRDIYR